MSEHLFQMGAQRIGLEVDPLELKDVRVVLTIVDGQVVFERPRT